MRALLALALVATCAGRAPAPEVVVEAPPTPAEIASRHSVRPLVIAHRGASARAPENTLVAYREAMALGALIAETDVHLSADGEVIVIHDRTVDRTTGGTGAVAEMTLAQIRELEAGSWKGPQFAGEPVPTLGELLDLAKGKLTLCVEVKAGQGIEERIVELLRERDQLDQVLVFSFDAAAVSRFEELEPRIPTVFLARAPRGGLPYGSAAVDAAEAAGADVLGMDHRRVEPLVVREAHARGFPVFVWTVNQPEAIRAAVEVGVDAVISDVPDVAEETIREGIAGG